MSEPTKESVVVQVERFKCRHPECAAASTTFSLLTINEHVAMHLSKDFPFDPLKDYHLQFQCSCGPSAKFYGCLHAYEHMKPSGKGPSKHVITLMPHLSIMTKPFEAKFNKHYQMWYTYLQLYVGRAESRKETIALNGAPAPVMDQSTKETAAQRPPENRSGASNVSSERSLPSNDVGIVRAAGRAPSSGDDLQSRSALAMNNGGGAVGGAHSGPPNAARSMSSENIKVVPNSNNTASMPPTSTLPSAVSVKPLSNQRFSIVETETNDPPRVRPPTVRQRNNTSRNSLLICNEEAERREARKQREALRSPGYQENFGHIHTPVFSDNEDSFMSGSRSPGAAPSRTPLYGSPEPAAPDQSCVKPGPAAGPSEFMKRMRGDNSEFDFSSPAQPPPPPVAPQPVPVPPPVNNVPPPNRMTTAAVQIPNVSAERAANRQRTGQRATQSINLMQWKPKTPPRPPGRCRTPQPRSRASSRVRTPVRSPPRRYTPIRTPERHRRDEPSPKRDKKKSSKKSKRRHHSSSSDDSYDDRRRSRDKNKKSRRH